VRSYRQLPSSGMKCRKFTGRKDELRHHIFKEQTVIFKYIFMLENRWKERHLEDV
jgi:hypothetical protein